MKTNYISLIILIFLILLIWLPVFFEWYGIVAAISITVGVIAGGFAGDFVRMKMKKKEQNADKKGI